MSKDKLNKQKPPFSQVPNNLNYSDQVSLKAKGLYSYLQAKPDDWEFAAYRIAYECKESEGTIQNTLKELEKTGYLIREKYQNSKGYWKISYTLLWTPSVNFPKHKNPRQENPKQENPDTGILADKQRNSQQTNKQQKKRESKTSPAQERLRQLTSEEKEVEAYKQHLKQKELEETKKEKPDDYNQDGLRPYAYMKQKKRIWYEKFYEEFGKNIKNGNEFLEAFNDKYDYEGKEYDPDKIYYRLRSFARNWLKNEEKNKTQEKRSKFL